MAYLTYYRELIRRSSRDALLAVGFKGRFETTRTVILWTISVLILYKIKWRSVPLLGGSDPNISDEPKFSLSGLISILIVFLTILFWYIILQPAKMALERESMKDNELRTVRDQNTRLLSHLTEIRDAERALQELSDLYYAGRDQYMQYAEKEIWCHKLQEWADRVEVVLKCKFSVAALHKFRAPGSGFEIRTSWNWSNDKDDRWLKARFTSKLHSLDELTQSAKPLYLARLKQESAIEENETKQSVTTPNA